MKSREGANAPETEIIERVRTPIDERLSLVVRTRPAPGPRYRSQKPAPDIAEITIEDAENGNVAVDLSALLAEVSKSGRGASFTLENEFTANSPLRLVRLSERELSDPKEILSVLHELGHLAINDEREEKDYDRLREIRTAQEPTTEELLTLLQSEHDAWAVAIRLARIMKEDYDVNLFKLFKNPADLSEWLHSTSLRTYEEELEELGIHTQTQKTGIPNIEFVSPDDFGSPEKLR